MIQYNGKDWTFPLIKFLRVYRESYDLKRQFKIQSTLLIYSVGVTYLLTHFHKTEFKIDPLYFSLVGVVLSLMLVFRLNTGYDRWYEGRKQWGLLVNHSRFIAQYYQTQRKNNTDSNRRFFAHLSAFPWAFAAHLRGEGTANYAHFLSAKDLATVEDKKHKPQQLIGVLQSELSADFKAGHLDGDDKRILGETMLNLYNILGACERILKTPIPFSHNYFIKSFILIYTAAIPFGLYHFFQWWTFLATFVIGYALIGIEVISEAIEEPFGRDANDLPLEQMSQNIQGNIAEICGIDFEAEQPQNKTNWSKEWILH